MSYAVSQRANQSPTGLLSRFVSVPERQAFLIIVHVEVFVKLLQGIPSRSLTEMTTVVPGNLPEASASL